jgi:hypothetical protein
MDYSQSLAIWFAMKSTVAGIRGRGTPQEEVFVPFNLPPLKPEPAEDAKPAVAVPASSSEAMPVGV